LLRNILDVTDIVVARRYYPVRAAAVFVEKFIEGMKGFSVAVIGHIPRDNGRIDCAACADIVKRARQQQPAQRQTGVDMGIREDADAEQNAFLFWRDGRVYVEHHRQGHHQGQQRSSRRQTITS